jgi:hypothetical protein
MEINQRLKWLQPKPMSHKVTLPKVAGLQSRWGARGHTPPGCERRLETVLMKKGTELSKRRGRDVLPVA